MFDLYILASDIYTDEFEVMLILMGLVCALLFIVNVPVMVGQAILFKKAGDKFWKAFIPLYNEFVLCKISGTNMVWPVLYIVSWIMLFTGLLFIVWFPINIMYRCILAAGISKSFGKGFFSTIGLIFLPWIFYLVVGISAKKYFGPKGCHDPFTSPLTMGDNLYVYQDDPSPMYTVKNNYKFCYKCGYRLSDQDHKCPKCGIEL